jgi:hypothetical protein
VAIVKSISANSFVDVATSFVDVAIAKSISATSFVDLTHSFVVFANPCVISANSVAFISCLQSKVIVFSIINQINQYTNPI